MKTEHPLLVGDRVRHVGQQYTGNATATIIEVKQGALGTWEYRVKEDPRHAIGDGRAWWNSEATIYVTWSKCPDDGRCWHECGETSCFRVNYASPFGAEDWSDEVKAAHPIEGVKASIETTILSDYG